MSEPIQRYDAGLMKADGGPFCRFRDVEASLAAEREAYSALLAKMAKMGEEWERNLAVQKERDARLVEQLANHWHERAGGVSEAICAVALEIRGGEKGLQEGRTRKDPHDFRPIDRLRAHIAETGNSEMEGVVDALLGTYEAAAELGSKVELPEGKLAVERFRSAMLEADVAVLGTDQEEAEIYLAAARADRAAQLYSIIASRPSPKEVWNAIDEQLSSDIWEFSSLQWGERQLPERVRAAFRAAVLGEDA